MISGSLKLKVGVYLVIALMVAMVLFTFPVIRNNRDELLAQSISVKEKLQ